MAAQYVVIEIQNYDDGTVGTLVNSYEDRDSAASKFHTILAAAAISQLPCHGATWLNVDGSLVDWKAFRHSPSANTSEVTNP